MPAHAFSSCVLLSFPNGIHWCFPWSALGRALKYMERMRCQCSSTELSELFCNHLLAEMSVTNCLRFLPKRSFGQTDSVDNIICVTPFLVASCVRRSDDIKPR